MSRCKPLVGLFSRGSIFCTLSVSGIALLTSTILLGVATAQTYTVLHSFGSGTDGATPVGMNGAPNGGDPDGFWGATLYGGTSGGLGTVFRFYTVLSGGKPTLEYAVAHNFTGPPDGAYPKAAPIGTSEFGLGTTFDGGNTIDDLSYGTAYKVTFDDSEFQFATIYDFCSAALCDDGSHPVYGLSNASTVLTYGTTGLGGTNNAGTIFQVDPTTGAETVLYDFGLDPANGEDPNPSGLYSIAAEPSSPLYGTTENGGSSGYGTVFSFVPSTSTFSTLHTFTGAPDGEYPTSGVAATNLGPYNIYGTTTKGGEYGYGTIFEINSSGAYSILYNFTGGADGSGPGELVWAGEEDGDEILYGIAGGGGAYSGGTLFEFSSSGGFAVLYSFCQQSGCADGGGPSGSLVYEPGFVYGTTLTGGAYGEGVAYKLQL
jgi:uncharacterized repeat protein (TIGR03803 family)